VIDDGVGDDFREAAIITIIPRGELMILLSLYLGQLELLAYVI
jgi:hypothetical protein